MDQNTEAPLRSTHGDVRRSGRPDHDFNFRTLPVPPIVVHGASESSSTIICQMSRQRYASERALVDEELANLAALSSLNAA